jgi:hypothetical protein
MMIHSIQASAHDLFLIGCTLLDKNIPWQVAKRVDVEAIGASTHTVHGGRILWINNAMVIP